MIDETDSNALNQPRYRVDQHADGKGPTCSVSMNVQYPAGSKIGFKLDFNKQMIIDGTTERVMITYERTKY